MTAPTTGSLTLATFPPVDQYTITIPAASLALSRINVRALPEGPVNTNATRDVPVNREMCEASGWNAYPGELVKQWDGRFVLREFEDEEPPQEYVVRHAESGKGPLRPEPVGDEIFIDAVVTAEVSVRIVTQPSGIVYPLAGGLTITEQQVEKPTGIVYPAVGSLAITEQTPTPVHFPTPDTDALAITGQAPEPTTQAGYPLVALYGIGFNRTNEMPSDTGMADEWSFYDLSIINWTPAQNTKASRTADVAAIINDEFKTYLIAYIDILRIDRDQARWTGNNDNSVDIVAEFEAETGPDGGATWTPNDWFGHRNTGAYDSAEDGKEMVNYTNFVETNASGQYAWERSAEYHIYDDLSLDEFALDGVYLDNCQPVLPFSETNTDFLRNGQGTISRFDSGAVERRSQAVVNVADYCRTEMRGASAPADDAFVVCNGGRSFENDTIQYETYKDAAQGLLHENVTGKSSINAMGIAWDGSDSNAALNWEDTYNKFRSNIAHINTKGPNGYNFSVFQGAVHDDNYTTARMVACSAWIAGGFVGLATAPKTYPLDGAVSYGEALRIDEMVGGDIGTMTEQQKRENRHYLGGPTENPPTSAWSKGVWKREFENGICFVNPKNNGQQTFTVADEGLTKSGYHLEYINGGQDGTRNPGGDVGATFTMYAGPIGGDSTGDGLVLLWVAD